VFADARIEREGIPHSQAGKNFPVPLGLPAVPIPPDNPPTAETIALGRKLFNDKLFSRDNSLACATCHDPKTGFSDANQFSKGYKGQLGGRQSMSLLNAAYHFTQFWDGRALSLEHQAEFPVRDPRNLLIRWWE
jgi:cytochrome c peroxidase